MRFVSPASCIHWITWSRPRRSASVNASRLHEPSCMRSISARLSIRAISRSTLIAMGAVCVISAFSSASRVRCRYSPLGNGANGYHLLIIPSSATSRLVFPNSPQKNPPPPQPPPAAPASQPRSPWRAAVRTRSYRRWSIPPIPQETAPNPSLGCLPAIPSLPLNFPIAHSVPLARDRSAFSRESQSPQVAQEDRHQAGSPTLTLEQY